MNKISKTLICLVFLAPMHLCASSMEVESDKGKIPKITLYSCEFGQFETYESSIPLTRTLPYALENLVKGKGWGAGDHNLSASDLSEYGVSLGDLKGSIQEHYTNNGFAEESARSLVESRSLQSLFVRVE